MSVSVTKQVSVLRFPVLPTRFCERFTACARTLARLVPLF